MIIFAGLSLGALLLIGYSLIAINEPT